MKKAFIQAFSVLAGMAFRFLIKTHYFMGFLYAYFLLSHDHLEMIISQLFGSSPYKILIIEQVAATNTKSSIKVMVAFVISSTNSVQAALPSDHFLFFPLRGPFLSS